MSVYSVNLARQLYVVKSVGTVNESAAVGTILLVDNTSTTGEFYLKYMGAGGQIRTDLVQKDCVMYAKATKAEKLTTELKSFKITIDSAALKNDTPIAGQEYILRLTYPSFVGMSDQDFYFEYGDVYATAGMSASDLYKKLAISLAKNTAKQGIVSIKLATADSTVAVTTNTAEATLSGTYTGIVIEENEPAWTLGIKAQLFSGIAKDRINSVPVTVDGTEVHWAVVTEVAQTPEDNADRFIKNGKKIADLEWFCMGERGDMYRGIGWPNNIPTTYLVDSNSEYNVIDIHYAFVDSNEGVQKSEKDLTLVIPTTVSATALCSALSTATGKTISLA